MARERAGVAEPAKLYGPHTLVIVLKTSACPWGTRIIHDSTFHRIITEDIAVLQQLIQIYYLRVEERKYYKP
jgi:hypothetical protein